MSTEFDVVIVAYRSRPFIESCVMKARTLAGVGDVVVVDHGDDSAGDIAHAVGARIVRDPTNPGFGTGQNRGVAVTNAPYVLLLNPDADPDPVGVAAACRGLDASPRVAAVQGVIVNRATRVPERSQGRELGPVHLLGRAIGARRLLCTAPCDPWPAASTWFPTMWCVYRARPSTWSPWLPQPCSFAVRRSTRWEGSTNPSSSMARTSTSAVAFVSRAGNSSRSRPERVPRQRRFVEHDHRTRALVVAGNHAVLRVVVVTRGLGPRGRRGHDGVGTRQRARAAPRAGVPGGRSWPGRGATVAHARVRMLCRSPRVDVPIR